jgi:hypothetical protein
VYANLYPVEYAIGHHYRRQRHRLFVILECACWHQGLDGATFLRGLFVGLWSFDDANHTLKTVLADHDAEPVTAHACDDSILDHILVLEVKKRKELTG